MHVTRSQQEEYAQNGVLCVRHAVNQSLVSRLQGQIDLRLVGDCAMELGGEELPLDTAIKPDSARKS